MVQKIGEMRNKRKLLNASFLLSNIKVFVDGDNLCWENFDL